MMRRIVFGAVLLLGMSACSSEKQPASPSFDDVLASRRSVRNYDASRTITEPEVRTLLAMVQDAPSWANGQPTRYYAAVSPDKVEAVKKLVGERNAENIAGAPVVPVSTFRKGLSGFFRGDATNEVGDGWGAYDNGLSDAYLILAARSMGFDTLIMGYRDADGLRQLFGIPEEEAVMAVIALGYRADDPTRPARKSLDEIVKFF